MSRKHERGQRGCQPFSTEVDGALLDPDRLHALVMAQQTSEEASQQALEQAREAALVDHLKAFKDSAGSYQKAVRVLKDELDVELSVEGLRKAIESGPPLGPKMRRIAERISKVELPAIAPPERARDVARDDPYPHRPAAVETLRGLVEDAVIAALLSTRLKDSQEWSSNDWVKEGLRIQHERSRIKRELTRGAEPPELPQTQEEDPDAPRLSEEAIRQTEAKLTKKRGGRR